MSFNSVSFLVFFPMVVFILYVLPGVVRKYWLLIASYYFYMCWNAKYALLIAFSTLVTYVSGIIISKSSNNGKKKFWIIICIVLNLLILAFFKYSNFVIDTINSISSIFGNNQQIGHLDILLPVGISFYTFQALGYIIDVYRGETAEKNICDYALFISFFPQLVAGPIERASNMLSQIKELKNLKININNIYVGLLRMGWGLFQKIVVSDRLALVVDTIFNNYEAYGMLPIIFATILFAFQIYCDFDGYTNIARGAAKVMNINLMTNFRQPYLATSINDFWKRWHISLTGWFRDYLYIPLGGNRKGKTRKYVNIMVIFLVSGLWHGAGWTFVFWGLLHGCAQIASSVKNRKLTETNVMTISKRIRKMIVTFIVVDFAWFFFRVPDFATAKAVIMQMFTRIGDFEMITDCLNISNWRILWIGVLLVVIVDILHEKLTSISNLIISQEIWLRYIIYIFFIVSCIYLGVNLGDDIAHQFIYFQF